MRAACVACIAALACGGSGDDHSDTSVVTALFAIDPGDAGFYALPFPIDIRSDPDGTVALSSHPRPNPLTNLYIDAIDETVVGFSRNPVIYFRFDGEIDEDTLPVSPADSLATDSTIYLLDVDPLSPGLGRRVPIRWRFETSKGSVIGENWLAMTPYPGFVLREGTKYAAVVTRRLHGGRAPVAASDEFAQIARNESAPELSEMFLPLWQILEEHGVDQPEDIVSATVFTTQVTGDLLKNARVVIHDQAAPVARDIAETTGGSHSAHYEGMWTAPNFQQGQPPYRNEGGGFAVGDDGAPEIQRNEDLRFAVSVPLEETPEGGWPVVLYSHGTGGSYRSFINNGVADRLAAEGIATISMDQVLHGPRDPTSSSPELNFFNFLNPAAARDNTLQGAVNLINMTRLVQTFDYDDVVEGRKVAFDPSRILFFGHSQGGLIGVPFLAVEPDVGAAVLSGAGGLLRLALLLKTEPIDITALISTIIQDDPVDEFNPVLALLQTYLDRSDGINYASQIVVDPPADQPSKDVVLGEGFVDRYTPPATTEALAVAIGAELASPSVADVPGLGLAGRETVELPISGNVAGTTAVLAQYSEASGSDGHFVFFDVPSAVAGVTGFLASYARDGSAIWAPPP